MYLKEFNLLVVNSHGQIKHTTLSQLFHPKLWLEKCLNLYTGF